MKTIDANGAIATATPNLLASGGVLYHSIRITNSPSAATQVDLPLDPRFGRCRIQVVSDVGSLAFRRLAGFRTELTVHGKWGLQASNSEWTFTIGSSWANHTSRSEWWALTLDMHNANGLWAGHMLWNSREEVRRYTGEIRGAADPNAVAWLAAYINPAQYASVACVGWGGE